MHGLTRIEMDITFSQGCANPDCKDPFCGEEMYIHQACHPLSVTNVTPKNSQVGNRLNLSFRISRPTVSAANYTIPVFIIGKTHN